jgi:predicted helicase
MMPEYSFKKYIKVKKMKYPKKGVLDIITFNEDITISIRSL